MRSIRLSLILYFLLLLVAALTGVAYFCYQSTQEAFVAKETSTRKLWEKQFEESRARECAEFDAKLLGQVRNLGKKAVWYHHRIEMLSVCLGAVGSYPHSGAPLSAALPVLVSLDPNPKNITRLFQLRAPDLRIQSPHSEDELYVAAVEEGQFFQTYLAVRDQPGFPPFTPKDPASFPPKDPGKIPAKDQLVALEASDSLHGLVWKLDQETRAKADDGQMVFDDVKLASGQTVRRVTMKISVSVSRRGIVFETPAREHSVKGKVPGVVPVPPVGEDRNYRFKPPLYLQYGVETSARDDKIAGLRASLERDLDNMRSDLDHTRAELRTRLLWIGLGTFAALVVGGFVLVWLGLSPLKRLSDAVSRVSEKDFRLPIDQAKLPRELKPIASRLSHTLEQLKHAFDREKQAAADLSHELRTPVAALLTTLEIALRKQRSADEYREVLSDCRESGQQISNLVERLLALARLDAGAEQLRPCEVDVAALADQCAALVRPLAEARGLHVDVHHNGPAFLNADPNKLREVLTNLLHNAIEYNRPNGAVDVRVQRNNGQLDMEVRDTGIGMAPEVRQHIFERFFRADPSRQADGPHAGLGLAIVKGYVDLMGGSIEVNSTVGQGSTFRIRLPAAPR
jgi:signal transduction histidine kinase